MHFVIKYDAAVDFRASVFRRCKEAIAENRLENAMEGEITKEKIIRMIEEDKELE